MPKPSEHFDVLIVGAGLSGISAAHHLRKKCPNKTFVILENRASIGGTWDLFRYPGVRSDSDMLTMAYAFRPWKNPKAISDGHSILQYITETAREAGIAEHIRFHHRVLRAEWSTKNAHWKVEASRKLADGRQESVTITCNFLFSCAGYYKYSAGYTPEFPGRDRFKGTIVHPQAWPQELNYSGKRVVVIGSGATAVTLVPAMAKTAAHVTMLQRSPTYIVSYPEVDAIAIALARVLPSKLAYAIARWKNIGFMTYMYRLARRKPELAKKEILKRAAKELGAGYDIATHFTPKYYPWEQRLCLVPDSDLFVAIREGRANVATDQIETFTENGIQLKSGRELEADIIVTATGLVLEVLGGIELSVDGKRVDFSKALSYKGVMFSDVPNLASVFGYINASWTLKADLIAAYVARLLRYMDKKGYVQVTPRNREPAMSTAGFVEHFSSGYVQRALAKLPKQGAKAPWRVKQNYFADIMQLRYAPIANETLEFSRPYFRASTTTRNPIRSLRSLGSRLVRR
jgi:cation diffusion facilitator CzcD-associated flavoprotein CzcO